MGYQTRFFTNLKKIYNDMDNSYPDVTLHSIEDGMRKECHRIVLAASSDYFTNVFSWSKSTVLEVHNGITGDTIEVILRYIYSGQVHITPDNVNDILAAANYFSILEIVDSCITFIVDNLEVKTCIDLLLFSWQLDLSTLVEEIKCFVTRNFSNILDDPFLKEQLISLPVKLMLMLLKSNDLILRDQTTKLPTRPAEREKFVLDFILSYTENLSDCSDYITSLLSCVKWPLLNIFDEEEFVFKFVPLFDHGRREAELKGLYHVTHSDWFRTSLKYSSATSKDKLMYGTRAFSCSELIALDPLAGGDEVGGDSTFFSIIAKENEHIKQLDVITHLWDGKTVVGGLNIHFTSSGNDVVCHHAGVLAENGTSVFVIDLKNGEHITGVFGNSSWLVDSLTFETSDSRCFGPYGGDGGETKDLMKTVSRYREEGVIYNYKHIDGSSCKWNKSIVPGPHIRIPLDSIVVGITGKQVTTQGNITIRHLRFIFRQMVPSSDFLITSDKRCERSMSSNSSLILRLSSEPSDNSDDDYEYMHNYGYYDLEYGYGGYWGMGEY